ncbi:MAG TPA: helix-turn-helix domain-containing protein [Solirubrobacterales bacterium]|nr:helix-turn-helix domain-containing protein [Solirubrobacterales bacterium]
MQRSIEQARVELGERLRVRRREIEEALLTRTYAIADPKEAADPEYEQGLRAAVSASLEYGLAAVEHGEERSPQVPILLLAQARLAARNGVPLDTVLRRYFAGYTLLGDFIVQEAGAANLGEPWLKQLLREQAAQFDRFLATVAEEHGREDRVVLGSPEGRRAEQVERLLAGELLDTSQLGYAFDGFHLGLLASGVDAREAIRELAGELDRRLLVVDRIDGTVWAWLGGRRSLGALEVKSHVASKWSATLCIALGEVGEGLTGWRQTHRQAKAAFAIALRQSEHLVRYADVALLTAALQDDLLSRSLRDLYLLPLSGKRDGGPDLRVTLRTYFVVGRNVSSAAATLNVSRQTIRNRIQVTEERLGCKLEDCGLELEFALYLDAGEAISLQYD